MHQVLETLGLPAWRVFAWAKFTGLAVQLRPKALRRTFFFNGDPDQVHAMRWYTAIGRKVWFHEVANICFAAGTSKFRPRQQRSRGKSMAAEDEAMALAPQPGRVVPINERPNRSSL